MIGNNNLDNTINLEVAMVSMAGALDSLVSISQFNKGYTSRIFDKLKEKKQMVVLKNNEPAAILLSPEEYARLAEAEEDYLLLCEALRRMEQSKYEPMLSMEEVMKELGVTQEELDALPDSEME